MTVKNAVIESCVLSRVQLGPLILDEVRVDNLRVRDGLFVWAPALRHVVLRGPIGSLAFRSLVDPASATDAQQRAFDRANAEFYQSVDWALDIREAEFADVQLIGIPHQLVLRDPETQVVVTRAKAAEGGWRRIDLHPQLGWELQELANGHEMGRVMVAPKRSKGFRTMLRDLQRLREAGVAEAD